MKLHATHLPVLITSAICIVLILYGPVPQLQNYHDFADQAVVLGIPHAANVLSNIGFAVVAGWGWLCLSPRHKHPAISAGWPGYRLFLLGLLLTAVGSGFYHLAPDNLRLVWDRLPIALACAGLLAAVRAETHARATGNRDVWLLAIYAVGSVGWWHASIRLGAEDLRPYLLLQILPMLLIPLWQALYLTRLADRAAFAAALAVYAAAKAAEIYDQAILESLLWLSGHTVKHLLATAAAGIIVWQLSQRVHPPLPVQGELQPQLKTDS